MIAPSILPARGGNKLLAGLSVHSDERHILQLSLSRTSLAAGACFGPDVDRVLFLEKGIVSQTIVTGRGESLEIAMIGSEGAVGLLGMGVGDCGFQFRALTAVEALQISAPSLGLACARGGELEGLLRNYSQSLLRDAVCALVCHYHHVLDRKLPRWLLVAAERLGSNRLFITQEILAEAHGVTVAAINLVLDTLEKKRLIERARGQITILNRRRLRSTACRCYLSAVMEKKYIVKTHNL